MNKPDELLKKMIEEGKVINNGSKFHIHNRIESWKAQTPHYHDADLDKLKKAMLEVFNEEDPQYELEKSNRIFANFRSEERRVGKECL